MRLIAEVNVDDTDAIAAELAESDGRELTLAGLARRIESAHGSQPIDPAWLKRTNSLVAGLKDLLASVQSGARGERGPEEEVVVSGIIKDGLRRIGAA